MFQNNDRNGWWTLTAEAGYDNVYYVQGGGSIAYYETEFVNMSVHPTVYISSEVKITGGNGNQTNPYTLG